MHGPARVFWADLTPSFLAGGLRAGGRGGGLRRAPAGDGRAGPHGADDLRYIITRTTHSEVLIVRGTGYDIVRVMMQARRARASRRRPRCTGSAGCRPRWRAMRLLPANCGESFLCEVNRFRGTGNKLLGGKLP
jgi:hypothetical protein